MRTVYRFLPGEPRGQALQLMLDAALNEGVTRLGLIEQRRSRSRGVTGALNLLGPNLIGSENVSAWPGSELVDGHTATRHLLRFDARCVEIFGGLAESITDWENPELLDDPHLLRPDGSVWFGYTGCDEYAWMELTLEEFERLTRDYPDLAALLTPDPESLAES